MTETLGFSCDNIGKASKKGVYSSPKLLAKRSISDSILFDRSLELGCNINSLPLGFSLSGFNRVPNISLIIEIMVKV